MINITCIIFDSRNNKVLHRLETSCPRDNEATQKNVADGAYKLAEMRGVEIWPAHVKHRFEIAK